MSNAVAPNPLIEPLRIEPVTALSGPGDLAIARELLTEYGRFVLEATGPARFCAAHLEEEIEHPAESYASRGGELLLAFAGETAAGCAGYRLLVGDVPEGACELKRMWVRPQVRGASIGRLLAEEVFRRAAAAGYEAIYLDTEPDAMPDALRLYQRLGFVECAAYNSEVAAGLRFFRRDLP